MLVSGTGFMYNVGKDFPEEEQRMDLDEKERALQKQIDENIAICEALSAEKEELKNQIDELYKILNSRKKRKRRDSPASEVEEMSLFDEV